MRVFIMGCDSIEKPVDWMPSLLATRVLGALLYGVSPTDPLTLILTTALFLVVAMFASARETEWSGFRMPAAHVNQFRGMSDDERALTSLDPSDP
jgi:hypothetical protein